jgi:competence protein ComEC
MCGWRDVTRDVSHEPRIAQFRIDLRAVTTWLESKLPASLAKCVTNSGAWLLTIFFRAAEMVALTLVLQFGMLPLMARDFHRVTLSGPIANLLAVPLTGVLVPLGFATLLVGWFFPVAGAMLGIPLRWLTFLLLRAVAWVAHFPHWSYRIPAPPLWLVLLFFAAAVFLGIALRFPTTAFVWLRRSGVASVAVLALLIVTYPFAPQWRKGWLELNVLDVGQGDSLFLVSPAGHTILVDAAGPFSDNFGREETRGPDSGEDAVSPYLWSRGFQQVDVVALTHAHQDHIGGLPAIFENFHVKALWIGREVAFEQQKKLERLAASHGATVVHELRGTHLDWDNATLDFLWPQTVPEEVAPSAKNDDSLVFRVSYGERHLLLPGDAEKSSEHAILSETEPEALRAEVLKVGHHGSKNSTTPEFLETVRPRLAVISAGEENPYGHPSPVLLDRLQQAGVAILRTDQNGAIHIATDGKRFEVSCFVPCPATTEALNLGVRQANAPDHQQNDEQQ